MHIIETHKLTHIYRDGTEALKGIDFQTHRSEVVAVLGANGAGKTTFLKHLNGLLQPASGKVLIRGEEINKDNLIEVRKTVGLVFQNPDDQLFAPTVWQDVAFGPINLGLSREVVEHRVKESLEMVAMQGFGEKPPYHLSGGQKKRVAIAGILAMEPQVIILDEPTSGLDSEGEAMILEMVLKLKAVGISVIIATHNVDLVPHLADRVYLLHHGKVVMEGTPKEVFSTNSAWESHLRLPYVTQLMDSLNRNGLPVARMLTVESAREEIMKASRKD